MPNPVTTAAQQAVVTMADAYIPWWVPAEHPARADVVVSEPGPPEAPVVRAARRRNVSQEAPVEPPVLAPETSEQVAALRTYIDGQGGE